MTRSSGIQFPQDENPFLEKITFPNQAFPKGLQVDTEVKQLSQIANERMIRTLDISLKGKVLLNGDGDTITSLYIQPEKKNGSTLIKLGKIDTPTSWPNNSYTAFNLSEETYSRQSHGTTSSHQDSSDREFFVLNPELFSLEEIESVMEGSIAAVNETIEHISFSDDGAAIQQILKSLERYNQIALQALMETTHKNS